MTFIRKDFAYGAENPALIFIFIALLIRTNSLGYISCGNQNLKIENLNEIESAWVVKFNAPYSYLPFEIAKIKPRKISSPQNRKIKYPRTFNTFKIT